MAAKHQDGEETPTAGGEKAAGVASHDVQAGLGGLDGGAHSVDTNAAETAAKPSSEHEAQRQKAVKTGRALFDLPEPISIAEATELMNDLKRQKEENTRRKSALDQRGRELEVMESDLEARRLELIALAEKIDASMPDAGANDPSAQSDPTVVAKIAKALEAMEPQQAAKVLESYTPERAAEILLRMADKKMALVLGQVEGTRLDKFAEALLKAKAVPTDE